MQKVVRQVIADVAKNSATKYSYCSVPIVEENCMCELVERCCESNKEGRWHNEPVFVHWEIMVDAVKEEVCCDANSIIG